MQSLSEGTRTCHDHRTWVEMLKDSAMGHPLPWTPTVGPDMREDVEQCDAIIIGAGVTGLYQLYYLRQRGLSVRVYEEGGAWAAPGIGIATRARASTLRVTPTAMPSRRPSCRNGTGKNSIPASRRTSATSISNTCQV